MKKTNLLFILLTAAFLFTALFFGAAKQGLFLDEIYSYGLSNSYRAPFLKDVFQGDLEGKLLTPEVIRSYLTVTDHPFSYGSVWYNQSLDVHPPLFYLLLHTVCSFFPGSASKWAGIAVNCAAGIVLLLLLRDLGMQLFRRSSCALAAVCIFGLSPLLITHVIYIRMYCLLAVFTVLLAGLLLRLRRLYLRPEPGADLRKRERFLLCGITLTIFAGMMTQYYFVLYAFFLCAELFFTLLFRREWKRLLLFTAAGFAGIFLFLGVWPHVFRALEVGDAAVSGDSALSNLLSPFQYYLILIYAAMILRRIPAAALVLVLGTGLFFLRRGEPSWHLSGEKKQDLRDAAFVIAPAVLCFLLQVVISPFISLRYVFNVTPFFALLAVLPFSLISAGDAPAGSPQEKAAGSPVPGAVLFVLCLLSALLIRPDYLYPEHRQYNDMIRRNASLPCLYFQENVNPPVTQDLLQLELLEHGALITARPDSPAAAEYLKPFDLSSGIVIYMDSSSYSADVLLPDLMERYGMTEKELLYSFDLSGAWLLKP